MHVSKTLVLKTPSFTTENMSSPTTHTISDHFQSGLTLGVAELVGPNKHTFACFRQQTQQCKPNRRRERMLALHN